MQYNHSLSLLALAVTAAAAGKTVTAAKALAEAGAHASFADVLATVEAQLKAREKASLASKATKASADVTKLARAIAEAGAQDADKPGEDLRIEGEESKTGASADDEDGDDDEEGDDEDEDKEVARFNKIFSNLNRGSKK